VLLASKNVPLLTDAMSRLKNLSSGLQKVVKAASQGLYETYEQAREGYLLL
jgi:hypothetical protein